MGKRIKEINSKLINKIPDRHPNIVELYLCPDGYHFNFRNLQIKMNEKQFNEWKEALKIAKDKLGDRMLEDI